MPVLCAHNQPSHLCPFCASTPAADPEQVTYNGLPPWLGGARFDADRNMLLVTILVPVRNAMGIPVQQPVAFETTIEQGDEIARAFRALVDRARQASTLLEVVPTSERVDDDRFDRTDGDGVIDVD